jgi:diguanylate cyclase (GGDEF)-like protein
VAHLKRLLAVMREELSSVQECERTARYLAFHDDLTALPNRRAFREHLERAHADLQGKPSLLAVFYLDLDGFKALNDTHGHGIGDQLLHLVATRLTHALRAQDLVGRLGGDEYACLILGVSSRDRLEQIANTLFAAVSQPYTIAPLVLTVRPSIGIAVYPTDGISPDVLLAAADSAMYKAKRAKTSHEFADG